MILKGCLLLVLILNLCLNAQAGHEAPKFIVPLQLDRSPTPPPASWMVSRDAFCRGDAVDGLCRSFKYLSVQSNYANYDVELYYREHLKDYRNSKLTSDAIKDEIIGNLYNELIGQIDLKSFLQFYQESVDEAALSSRETKIIKNAIATSYIPIAAHIFSDPNLKKRFFDKNSCGDKGQNAQAYCEWPDPISGRTPYILCPGLMMSAFKSDNPEVRRVAQGIIYQTLAHEIGHNIHKALKNYRLNTFDAFTNCVAEKHRKLNITQTEDRLAEEIADMWSVRYAANRLLTSKSHAEAWRRLQGLGGAFCPPLAAQNFRETASTDDHPAPGMRIREFIALNPAIRSSIGCKAGSARSNAFACTLYGKTKP